VIEREFASGARYVHSCRYLGGLEAVDFPISGARIGSESSTLLIYGGEQPDLERQN